MMNEYLNNGLTYNAFLAEQTEEVQRKVGQRWDTMVMSTELEEAIKSLEPHVIIAFMRGECPDSMVVMPYLEKLSVLNPGITHRILPQGDVPHVPTLYIYTPDGTKVSEMVEFPERFKKRLKGLDEEDVQELVARYRKGYYNKELVEGLIKLMSAAV